MNDRFYSFLGLTKRAGKLLEGYNKCEEGILKNQVFLIIISEEASENTKDKFMQYCSKYDLVCINGCSKLKLGSAIGRAEINILGVKDKGMSERLLQLWKDNNNS